MYLIIKWESIRLNRLFVLLPFDRYSERHSNLLCLHFVVVNRPEEAIQLKFDRNEQIPGEGVEFRWPTDQVLLCCPLYIHIRGQSGAGEEIFPNFPSSGNYLILRPLF